MRHQGLLVLAMVAAAGCDARTQAPGGITPPVMVGAGVRSYVVQEPGSTPERTTLTIHIDAKDVPVASYQGQVAFDPTVMQILEASAPSDGTRLVNSAPAGSGLVKFAGFSTSAFTHTAAVRLVVRLNKPIEAAHVVASLDVVGEENGTAVARTRVTEQRGVYSAAATSVK